MQSLLIIGDGDFSFSKSLLNYIDFDNKCYVIATCYEVYIEVIRKYSQAARNIDFIKNNGGFVKTGVDGTKLHLTDFDQRFDTIIFNFPHQGGKSNVKKNRSLLKDFFASIKESNILNENGTVCISLCQGQAGTNIDIPDRDFGNSWQLEEMASQSSFYLFDIRQFDLKPFGDYIPTGFRSQEKKFRLIGARSYMFVRCDHCDTTNLSEQFTLNNIKYNCPSWIAEFLKRLSTNNSLNNFFIQNVIATMKAPVLRDWKYLMECCSGYKLTDMNGSASRLCCSPWQQVVNIILGDHSIGSPIVISHGVCFKTCDMSNENAVNSYFVIVERGVSSTIEARGPVYDIDHDDLVLIQNSGLSLTHAVQSSYDNNIPSIIATLSTVTNGLKFVVSVINVSQYLHQELSISVNDTFIDTDILKRHLSPTIIDRIFPIHYYDIESSLPSIMVTHTDVIRLLAQRSSLDIRPFRDISFWLPDPCMNINDVVKEVSEICRCVFRDHMDRDVTLVDDYLEEGSGARGVCLRMYLRSGLSALSRGMIISLLLTVGGHCERLLSVRLR